MAPNPAADHSADVMCYRARWLKIRMTGRACLGLSLLLAHLLTTGAGAVTPLEAPKSTAAPSPKAGPGPRGGTKSTPAPPGSRSYVVKKSDTLTGIARAQGVTVQQLITANGLSRSGHVRPGQVLRIPDARPPTLKGRPLAKPDELPPAGLSQAFQRVLDRTRVTPGRWDYIVVHHSATPMGTPQGMDRYHREQRHMENGLAYHFVIGNGNGMGDGQIAIGRRWTSQINGGHLASEALNARSLGICLVGNFDRDPPSQRQLDSLEALARYLMKRCGIRLSGVKTHQEINTIGTRCPGRLFDEQAFRRALSRP